MRVPGGFGAWLALAAAGCGGGPVATRGDPAAVRAEVEAITADLPAPPPDSVWGDGFGPSAREAALDAKRAVAEQIESRLASVTEADASESTAGGASVDVRTRVRSESRFDHGELIEVLAVEARPGGFAARAWLDRDRAAGVYREEIAEDAEKLRAALPLVSGALLDLDASVLLDRSRSPGFLLGEGRRKRRVLAALGRAGEAASEDAEAQALERRAAMQRQRTVLRLESEVAMESPAVEPAVIAAVEGELIRLFALRGCVLRTEPQGADVPEGAPALDVTVTLRARDHQERGVLWRYVGLDLRAEDARTGRALIEYRGPADIAHAGGATWAQADEALARRLRQVLGKKLPLDTLTCR